MAADFGRFGSNPRLRTVIRRDLDHADHEAESRLSLVRFLLAALEFVDGFVDVVGR
jgi:hypothetical protein